MAARQRLRAILDARRASQPCWRCALDFARCSSTGPTGIQESSIGKNRVSYEHLPQQKIDDGLTTAFPDIHLINASVYAQSATRSSDEPDGSVSQTVHEPPIRRIVGKRQTVGLRIASQSQLAGVDGKPLVRRIRFFKRIASQSQLAGVDEGRPVALAPQLQSNTSRASHKSGTRRAIKSRAPRKVLAKSVISKYLSTDRVSPIKWKVLHFGLPTKDKDKGMIRKILTTNNSIYQKESRLSKGPPNATPVPSESQPKDEVFLAELTSLMDSIRVSSSNLPPINTETGDSVSSPRSSPRYHARQSALTYSRSSNKDSPKTLSLTRTSKAANRHYATAASQTLLAGSPIDPPIIGTNQDGFGDGRPRPIREALRLWQEQHDIALADNSGGRPSSTLGDTQNLFTQSGEDDSFTTITRDNELDDDDEVIFDPEDRAPDISANHVFLRRGDLVELVAMSEPVLAIFVRNVADQCQFYTIRGQWVHRAPAGARWSVSRFVDPDDLNEILPYLPADEVAEEKMNRLQPMDVQAPRNAGAKVLEQMSLFQRAADVVFRKHAERINRLYEIIAPSEGFTDRTYMSLKDIAMKVLMKEDPSELTQPMIWAIHRAIAQCQNIVWTQMVHRQNPVYEIHPRQGLEYINQVRDWVREYQEVITQEATNESMFVNGSTPMESTRWINPIATFVRKAREAIRQSRLTRPLSKSGFIGPSSISIDIEQNSGNSYREMKGQKFDQNDKIIIHYLDVWATSSFVNAHTNLASLGPMILRAVGMYKDFELDQSRGFTLLQELGVLTPWENRNVYKVGGLRLPGHDGGFGEASRMLLDAHREAASFEPKDSMEGLRRDWKDLPVFCIDSAETLERDDGVSLELVENNLSAYWVHIHVANPSAFITPDSASAKYAALLSESVYFPEKRYPMLAPKVTHDQLSLANDRPCITFSAMISADGDMLEKRVTPGIVRNVHYLTPQMVGKGLGLTGTDEESDAMSILTVGGRVPAQPIDETDQSSKVLTDPEHIKVLRKLLELGEANRQKRAEAGAPDLMSSALKASTYPTVYLTKSAGKPFQIKNRNMRLFEGDPIIALQRPPGVSGLVIKMVGDLMIIAGDVGASWCSERNIPIPYRGILRNPEPASSPEVFKREVLEPQIAKRGHVEQADLRRYMLLIGQAFASDRPLEHAGLGLPAYCKATSPLRRYADLYAHWQMEAAIRHEAATGTSLIGSTDDSYLPFSRDQVAEYAEGAVHRERRITYAKKNSIRHWVCQALFRALYFNEATLPETFEVSSLRVRANKGFYLGQWDLCNLQVQLMHCAAVTKEGGCRVGDVWETRLVSVDPYRLNIEMEPLRLLERGGDD